MGTLRPQATSTVKPCSVAGWQDGTVGGLKGLGQWRVLTDGQACVNPATVPEVQRSLEPEPHSEANLKSSVKSINTEAGEAVSWEHGVRS